MGERLYTIEEFKDAFKAGSPKVLPFRKECGDVVAKANADGTLDFTLSSATPDRSSDVVTQEGILLTNYVKNPVVLWAHDYRGPPVARSPILGVDGGKLTARGVTFTPRELSEFGWMIGEMYRQKFLNAASIGFRPLKWNWNEERKMGIDFLESELLEWSCVPVPAHPEALVAAKAAGIPLGALKTWLEECALDVADPAAREKLLVPRDYAEQLWRVAAPQKVFSVPAVKADPPPAGEEPVEEDAGSAECAPCATACEACAVAVEACSDACELGCDEDVAAACDQVAEACASAAATAEAHGADCAGYAASLTALSAAATACAAGCRAAINSEPDEAPADDAGQMSVKPAAVASPAAPLAAQPTDEEVAERIGRSVAKKLSAAFGQY